MFVPSSQMYIWWIVQLEPIIMLRKMFTKEKTNPAKLLHQLNISNTHAHHFTDYQQLTYILPHINKYAPSPTLVLKHTKREPFTPSYLLKCAVLTHYYLQHNQQNTHSMLLQFAIYLMQKCNFMVQSMSNHCVTECRQQQPSKLNTSCVGGQQICQGKSYFLLKQIIRPYIAYIIKFSEVSQQQLEGQQNQQQRWLVWKHINLLNTIHGFTINFTVIGRYYMKQYGDYVILLSEALSVDINNSYQNIQKYIEKNERLICVYSGKREEKIEAQQFCRVLQQVGSINEKFTQFYMGKYFYEYLDHIQQPQWIDIDSKSFDRIFQATKNQPSHLPPTNRKDKHLDRMI